MTSKIYTSKANLSSDLQKLFSSSVYLIFKFSKAFQTQFFLIIFLCQLGLLPICHASVNSSTFHLVWQVRNLESVMTSLSSSTFVSNLYPSPVNITNEIFIESVYIYPFLQFFPQSKSSSYFTRTTTIYFHTAGIDYNINGTLRSYLTQSSSHRRGVKSGYHGQESVIGIVQEMLIFKQTTVRDTYFCVKQSKVTVDKKNINRDYRSRIQELRSLDSFSGKMLACTY